MSAWFRNEVRHDWIPRILHPAVRYGKRSSAQLDNVVALSLLRAQLFSAAAVFFPASLDYSMCFDWLKPGASAAVLGHCGLHGPLRSLCSIMWTFDSLAGQGP